MLRAERLTQASWASCAGQCTNGRGGGGQPIDVLVGRRLLARRVQLGLSHDDLAVAVDVPASRIAAYERGANRILPAHLLHFADLLGVRFRFFFDGA